MKKHPNKDIGNAIKYALKHGWEQVNAGKSSHAFCRLRCKKGHSEHQISVWSTPKDAETHARKIMQKVKRCR